MAYRRMIKLNTAVRDLRLDLDLRKKRLVIDLSQVKVLSNMLNLSESTLQEVFCSITITITSLAAPRVIISTSFPWLLSRD